MNRLKNNYIDFIDLTKSEEEDLNFSKQKFTNITSTNIRMNESNNYNLNVCCTNKNDNTNFNNNRFILKTTYINNDRNLNGIIKNNHNISNARNNFNFKRETNNIDSYLDLSNLSSRPYNNNINRKNIDNSFYLSCMKIFLF